MTLRGGRPGCVVVTIDDIAPSFEGFAPDARYERFEHSRTLLGTDEVDYEYDSAEAEPAVYLSSTSEIDRSARDTRSAYTGFQLGFDAVAAAMTTSSAARTLTSSSGGTSGARCSWAAAID